MVNDNFFIFNKVYLKDEKQGISNENLEEIEEREKINFQKSKKKVI